MAGKSCGGMKPMKGGKKKPPMKGGKKAMMVMMGAKKGAKA
jgi:hypothetical protein